jgi:hypothetical protein
MKLKSFGCSFMFGTELSDDTHGGHVNFPSQLVWPALLAKSLEYEYKCHARAGAGNLQILENILNQAATDDPSVFVIGWTWIDRFDYVGTTPWPGTTWSTIMPVDCDDLAKIYYKKLHSEYQDKLINLSYIKLAINTLEQKGIPFIMTYIDNLLFDSLYNVSPGVTDLQNHVLPYMTKFDNKTFLEFSKQQGFEISPRLHPLDDAHQSAFELIKSYNLL